MEKAEQYARDNLADCNDLEITRRHYPTLIPEWLMPNVRLKQQHFLPKYITPVVTEQEYRVYFHTLNERMEVYAFVRKLFEEHNSCAPAHKYRTMHIETAYLFCMDTAESSMSSNFFMFIPKSHYRRYLEDVPLLYSSKACIIVDYHRRLAYRFGLCIRKMTDEVDIHSEDRSSVADSLTDRSVVLRQGKVHRRRAADDFVLDSKQHTIADLMAINRSVQALHKKIEVRKEPENDG